jgi:hypothetical protein
MQPTDSHAPVLPPPPASPAIVRRLLSGKRCKFWYFLRGAASLFVPRALYRRRLRSLLDSIDGRPDRNEILARAAYCCKLEPGSATPLPPDAPRLSEQRLPWRMHTYFFDSREYLRYFPVSLRWAHEPGDITHVPAVPTVVKSRPIGDGNANGVLLNLNKIRHFVFVRDRLAFRDKADRAVFRGKVQNKEKRIRLFEKWYGNPLLDMGDTAGKPARAEWAAPKLTLYEQLRYKFVLSIEGNDVASNLKWILSSHSVAVMPRPQYETWFQEGLLVPDRHYIEIAPDYSDLEDKLRFYAARPDLCERIVRAGNEWVARFRDPARERLVSLLVLQRYFEATGQEFLDEKFVSRPASSDPEGSFSR